MRYTLAAAPLALAALLLPVTAAVAAPPAPALPPLEITWKLKQDLFGQNGRDLSVASSR